MKAHGGLTGINGRRALKQMRKSNRLIKVLSCTFVIGKAPGNYVKQVLPIVDKAKSDTEVTEKGGQPSDA